MKKLNSILIASLIISILVMPVDGYSQSKEKSKKSVNIDKSVENGETKITVKIDYSDGTTFEKVYASDEEMKNDPELEDLNLHFGHGDSDDVHVFKKGGEGDKMMFFRSHSDEGEGHENEFFERHKDGEYQWKTDEGVYKITRDESGEFIVEKDGEVVDIDDLEDSGVNVKVDGGVFIFEDGGQKIKVDLDSSHGENTFHFDSDHVDDGDLHFFRSDDSEDGEVEINVFTDVDTWVQSDGEGEKKVIIKSTGDIDDAEIQKLLEEYKTEDGNVFVKVVKIVDIEIVDLKSESELEDIPNVHLNSANADLQLDELNYFPNPSQGNLSLKFSAQESPLQIKVVDTMGRVVYNEQIQDFKGRYDDNINLAGNDPGVYILQVVQQDKSWSKKIILQ